jgi:hypothetical protein
MATIDNGFRPLLSSRLKEPVQRAAADRFIDIPAYVTTAVLAQLKADGFVPERKSA